MCFYDFDSFRIDAKQRLLFRDGKVVALTPKAYDTLLVLVQNSGQVVEKDNLLATVWRDSFVEAQTVAQNIFTLRKILGGSERHQYIQTVPTRGYRFLANVTEVKCESAGDEDDVVTQGSQRAEIIAQDNAIDSLAVLPLFDSSGDPNVAYLSDGLTETIINHLSLLPSLSVRACSTVLRYKGLEVDPQEVGKELGVRAVLIGRLVQFAQKLIIRTELVEVTNGWQLWGKEYVGTLTNMHTIQEEIANDILQNLHLTLTGAGWQRVLKQHIPNIEAHQFYLRGRYFLNMRTRYGYSKAREWFERAVQIDSDFALGYSGVADSHMFFDSYGLISPSETIPRARAAAVKAVEIDDRLAEAHTSLASIKLGCNRDAEGAARQFRHAISLNPKYAHAHVGYALSLMEMNQTYEALAECRLALEIEPLDLLINKQLGEYYLFARQQDQAIEQLNKTLELGPDYYRARHLLGIAYGQKGLFPEAIAELERARQLEDAPVVSGFLGYAYGMAGKTRKALKLVSNMLEQSKRSYVPPYSIALIHAGLGKREETLEWLERAYVEHSQWRTALRLTAEFDKLRGEERFIRISQRIRGTTHSGCLTQDDAFKNQSFQGPGLESHCSNNKF